MPKTENIESLKLDFEQKTGYKETNMYFLNPNFKSVVNWERIVWKTTDTAFIKVNVLDKLTYPLGDSVISLQDQVWIKAFKNSKKEWRYLLLTFIPLETRYSFSGTIISSSILSNSTKIATFSKGENIRNLDQTNVAAIEKYNRNMGSLVKMAAGKKCVYAYVNGQLNRISCTDTDEIDYGDGGIYDDPPPNPGDYYPTNPPIGGGDTGEQKEEENIENNIENPCLKKIVDEVISNDIASLTNECLLDVFKQNDKINLRFYETTRLPDLTAGIASTTFTSGTSNLDVKIELNANTLPNASQEYVALAVVHESIHAYLYTKGFFTTMIDQHDMMWSSYIDVIAGYLNQQYGTDMNVARTLATDGLQNTFGSKILESTYEGLNLKTGEPAEKRGIIATQYRNGQKGKKCNN
ncbi:SprT-like domain-containing protein [Sphingobacterium spiritivorum]|uniref:SprT-like domain-containing protein n=1 Tax=Sphingobacterium spiritivorum TaxID=258 RepID=UPI0036895DB4